MKKQKIKTSVNPLRAVCRKLYGSLPYLLILAACSSAIPKQEKATALDEPETAEAAEATDTAKATDTAETSDTAEATAAESEPTSDESEMAEDTNPESMPEETSSTAGLLATQQQLFKLRGRAVQAASCEYTAVLTVVRSAGIGTTVLIPAGDCNWGRHQLSVPAGIYLQGAGENATIIRREGSVPNTRYLIAYDCSNRRQAIFSGMTLVGNGNGAIQDKGLGLLNGCQDFKVHDSKFTDFIFSGIYIGDAPNQRGVIYKNKFIDNFSADLMNLGYGVVVYGGGAWPPLRLGSKNAVFVEDNYFSGNRHNIASNNGSVYVFRHNMVIGQDPAKDFAMTDAHGLSSSPRGSRSFEIYDNTYLTNIHSGLQRTAIGIRGGDGVIFNNKILGSISRGVELMPEGFRCGTYPGQDQIRSVYIWNNKSRVNAAHMQHAIDNACPKSIRLNRDYFLRPKPGYVPYPYPHPLRDDVRR